MPVPALPVTEPVALTLIAPSPLETTLMPMSPPVAVVAAIVRFPADEIRPSMPTPSSPVATTSPPALTVTAFALRPTALIPAVPPETASADMARIPADDPVSPRIPAPARAVTEPDAETLTSPVPLPTAQMPAAPPATDAAVMLSAPPLAFAIRPRMPTPSAPVPPVTAPVALMSRLPVPLRRASIPVLPETAAASMVTRGVLEASITWIPAVSAPVTAPLALMETAPVPLETTLIPTLPPVTAAAVTVTAPGGVEGSCVFDGSTKGTARA